MGWSVVNSASKDIQGGTTLVIDKPTNTASGDIMVAMVAYETGQTVTPPSGWTLIGAARTIWTYRDVAAYYRVAGGSEGSSYTWSFSASSDRSGVIVTYRGPLNTSTPIQATSDTTYTTDNTTMRAASLTTDKTHQLLVTLGAMYTTATGFTAPTNFTEDIELAGNATVVQGLEVAHRIWTSSGAHGVMDITAPSVTYPTTTRKHAWAVAINRLVQTLTASDVVTSKIADITFSSDIDQTTAEDESKWTISRVGGGGVPTFTATRQADHKVVRLTFDEALHGAYTVEATSVLDAAGYPLDAANDSCEIEYLEGTGTKRRVAVLL